MSVLLTGGAGFIGSHTAVEMIHAGYDVIIADDLSNASPKVIDRIETISATRPKFYQIDCCRQGRYDQAVSGESDRRGDPFRRL